MAESYQTGQMPPPIGLYATGQTRESTVGFATTTPNEHTQPLHSIAKHRLATAESETLLVLVSQASKGSSGKGGFPPPHAPHLPVLSVEQAMNEAGLGWYHAALFVGVGLNFLAVGMSTSLSVFLYSCLKAQWGISDSEDDLAVAAMYLGMLTGGVASGTPMKNRTPPRDHKLRQVSYSSKGQVHAHCSVPSCALCARSVDAGLVCVVWRCVCVPGSVHSVCSLTS